MKLTIPYSPHPYQKLVHSSEARFRVVAAGRRFGKTVLALNELIKQAIKSPMSRSWYVAPTYRQAEQIAWKDPKVSIFKYLPQELIESKSEVDLNIRLKSSSGQPGHLMEFKGADKEDRLRGVGLSFVVLDEYGHMKKNVWDEIIRPMLADTKGRALFIGTPAAAGSPHFYDLFKLGQVENPEYQSWLFYTSHNPTIPAEEIANAKRTLPDDIYKREWEADFSLAQGLIYDNFRYPYHIIPGYTPLEDDVVVCSIDPGLRNPTAALWSAWDKEGTCRLFAEYYQSDKLASENAARISDITKQLKCKVLYYVIDRSSIRRDPSSGLTIFNEFTKNGVRPLYAAPNDQGSVMLGINEVKKLLHIDPVLKLPRLYICSTLFHTINEIQNYAWYKFKWHVEKNPREEPRKLNDHLMDCLKNLVLTKPWEKKNMGIVQMYPQGIGY